MRGENTTLKRSLAAVKKGIPGERAEKYARLAESYMGEDGDFEKALDAALKDFPLAEAPKGVPGAGGNPPPAPAETKKPRPSGTVIF